ncbi:MAG: hypothetical protein CVU00_08570 [Bacteroidetes bacterium HGW-Bacteroidetes-17]|nr:MAG: hypothetical protein CVU00_08570 [Bacteroidetes bacterium HGW-Bacteroidetes-17]
MSIFSMQNEDGKEAQFFDLLIKKRVYYGLIYSIISIPIAALYFVFVFGGLLVGFALLPIWIGVPFLNTHFRIIWVLSKFEEKTFEKYSGILLPKISPFIPSNKSSYHRFIDYMGNKRTWIRIGYFSLKLFWRSIFAIPGLFLITLSGLLIYTPVNSVFGHIDIYSFYQTDSFIEVILIFFVCIIIWVSILHLINYLFTISAHILKFFFCR